MKHFLSQSATDLETKIKQELHVHTLRKTCQTLVILETSQVKSLLGRKSTRFIEPQNGQGHASGHRPEGQDQI